MTREGTEHKKQFLVYIFERTSTVTPLSGSYYQGQVSGRPESSTELGPGQNGTIRPLIASHQQDNGADES